MKGGRVYLVGAGPGDPGLLTLKAVRVLSTADVVVYDHLVADAILDRIPPHVERIYAGKEADSHAMNQGAINVLLEERAKSGQRIVRLKGGDPFVFGRGGEEAEHLSARGVSFEVVPGVSSAIGVPAYAGIPVTHRGVAASLAIVTGRARPVGEAPDVDWGRIAGADTIVLLMGVANHDHLVRALIEGGRRPDTPVAAIRWGTTARQRTVVGTLETIAARVHEAGLRPPAVLVVGPVVSLISRMGWVEQCPLFGCRVLVPAPHPSPLTEPLESLGAEILHVMPVEIAPPASWEAFDRALADLTSYPRLLFADEPGVAVFFERLAVHRRDARALAGRHIVADGQGAALALARHGVRADAVLDERDSLSPVESERWLVVGSPESQALTAAMLRRHGARCETPPAYSQSIPKWRADRLRELLTTRPVHAIAFTHAGEVRQLMSALDAEERRGLRRLILAVTGESTARALQEYNLIPSIIAGDRLLPEALAAAVGRGSGDGA